MPIVVNKEEQSNAALTQMAQISSLSNEDKGVGYILDTHQDFGVDGVSEWHVLGFYKKSNKLIVVPSATNSKEANERFENNYLISRDGDHLTVDMKIIYVQHYLFSSFSEPMKIKQLDSDAVYVRQFQIA